MPAAISNRRRILLQQRGLSQNWFRSVTFRIQPATSSAQARQIVLRDIAKEQVTSKLVSFRTLPKPARLVDSPSCDSLYMKGPARPRPSSTPQRILSRCPS
jgi:hypothetical protein